METVVLYTLETRVVVGLFIVYSRYDFLSVHLQKTGGPRVFGNVCILCLY